MDSCPVVTDPAALPPAVAVRILAYAYLIDADGQEALPNWYVQRFGTYPLRTVAPLVSRRWAALVASEEAKKVLWRRVHIEDSCIPKNFSPQRFHDFWARGSRLDHIVELDVSLAHMRETDGDRLRLLSTGLTDLIGSATSLCTLRLAGHLPVGEMFGAISPRLPSLGHLSAIYLAAGAQDSWGLKSCVESLAQLPNLKQLEIQFPK